MPVTDNTATWYTFLGWKKKAVSTDNSTTLDEFKQVNLNFLGEKYFSIQITVTLSVVGIEFVLAKSLRA